jgi:hypothetical protein
MTAIQLILFGQQFALSRDLYNIHQGFRTMCSREIRRKYRGRK